MKKCIIFCAAGFDALLEPIQPGDFVIAADGGLRHTQALDITPQAILGDFDSLGYIPADSTVYPVEKDDTDAMLAVRLGLRKGCREFILYGGLDGPRLDHTVANFQTLQFLAEHGAWGTLVGKEQLVTILKDGALTFPDTAQGLISLFCLGADARGVCIEGLQYPLDRGTLTAGFPLGCSNHFIGEKSRVQVESGSLLVIWSRENGLPGRM